jgi:hypothetical protein
MGADLGHGISAAERVGKHSEKLLSSSGRIASSTVSIPRRLSSSITVWWAMPFRKQSGIGV